MSFNAGTYGSYRRRQLTYREEKTVALCICDYRWNFSHESIRQFKLSS